MFCSCDQSSWLSYRVLWRLLIAVAMVCTTLYGCSAREARGESGNGWWPDTQLNTRGVTFRDAHGRQVILNGINYVDKEAKGTMYADKGAKQFAEFRNYGFNCVRLGIVWAGVEPEPGKYDEAYLAQIDQALEWAAHEQVYVILDMHQDLYSAKYSDGASLWATLNEGKPHIQGAVWSDSYFLSPAVQTSFDNFWANKATADGIGVQEHYAAMWRHVAKRYADKAIVVGYDLMNEPFSGTSATQTLPLILTAYGKIVAQKTGTAPSPLELMKTWADEKARVKALAMISSAEDYAKVIGAVEKLSETFETGPLQAMYQRVADAIREVDSRHVVFIEHGTLANLGVRCFLRPLTTQAGTPDLLVAYAPHAYDMLTDTAGVAGASNERVRLIYSRVAEKTQELGMPAVMGEWGAYYSSQDRTLVATARHAASLLDEFRLGNTYWAYDDGIRDCPYFREAIVRPGPVCVAGDLKTCRIDYDKRRLEVAWQESNCDGLPTVIFLPNLAGTDKRNITVTPPGKLAFERLPNSSAGYLLIYPAAKSASRKAVIGFSAKEAAAK